MIQKPTHLPKAAKWMDALEIWAIGKMVRKKPVGSWKIWNQAGALVLEGEFDPHHYINHCKVYHLNGELARQIRYDEDADTTHIMHIQCTEHSNEIFPAYNDLAWKAVAQMKGKTQKENGLLEDESAFTYFDKNEQLLSFPSRSAVQKIKKRWSRIPMDETALQAIDRLNAFMQNLDKAGYPYIAEIKETYQPHFYRKCTLEEIRSAEQRLQIELPPSYKHFITQNGLLRFGDKDKGENHMEMIPPLELNHLHYWFYEQWEMPEEESSDVEAEVMKKIICFFRDSQDIQYNALIAFDYSNPSVEVNIIDQIGCENWGWESQIGQPTPTPYSAMDAFLSKYVSYLIEEVIDL